MQLARFLNTVFKKDGFILIDANSKNYIIGTPKSETPIVTARLKHFSDQTSWKHILRHLQFTGIEIERGFVNIQDLNSEDMSCILVSIRPRTHFYQIL